MHAFIQVHAGIGRSPFEAMFGTAPRVGLQTWRLPPGVAASIETEEQLRQVVGASIDTRSERPEQAAAASSAGGKTCFNYLHKVLDASKMHSVNIATAAFMLNRSYKRPVYMCYT